MPGSATDYAIFLLGRYHEQRRARVEHEQALVTANRSVAPVIVAAGLTIATALALLTFGHTGIMRGTGLPCAIGILIGVLASLTLLPALIALAGGQGLAQPRTLRGQAGRQWRQVGTIVARWPAPVLVGSTLLLIVFAIPTAGLRLSFNELAAQPDTTPANRGFQAMDRHFPPNRLLPEIVFIQSDHDLRNPAGVIAVEKVAKKIMEVPGVRMVQSASRPAGAIPDQAALTAQAGIIGDQLDDGMAEMTRRLGAIDELSATMGQFQAAISQLQSSLSGGAGGLGQVDAGVDVMQTGVQQLRKNVAAVSEYMDPLRNITNGNPNCANDGICSLVLKVLQPVDSVVAATNALTNGATTVGAGAQNITKAFTAAQSSVSTMRAAVSQLSSVAAELSKAVGETRTMFSGLINYLRELRGDFQNSGEGGFYLPQRAWQDARFQRAAELYFAPDGRSIRMMVYESGRVLGTGSAQHSAQMALAANEAIKEGSLAGSTVRITGFGAAIGDIRTYVIDDFLLLSAVAVAMVFLIVLIMLRSPVAAAVVIGTVVVSYVSSLGLTTFIWQDLIGKDLDWTVPSVALIALVAVGADYNLLLTMRIREAVFGHGAGLRTGIIRSFGGTGGVVTTAGIVFGITMFALLFSDVLSIEQVGTAIGVGLIIDTLIVRTFVVPGLAGLLGRWFWWSPVPLVRGLLSRWRRSRAPRAASVLPDHAQRSNTPRTGGGSSAV